MTRTTLFYSNRSQAVRLPKDVAFPSDVREVAIIRDGNRRVIVPVHAHAIWDDFFNTPGIELPPRDQPVLSAPPEPPILPAEHDERTPTA